MLIALKCPQCNGELSVEEGKSTYFCPYCGSAVVYKSPNSSSTDEMFERWANSIFNQGDVKVACDKFVDTCFDDSRVELVKKYTQFMTYKPYIKIPDASPVHYKLEEFIKQCESYKAGNQKLIDLINGQVTDPVIRTRLISLVQESIAEYDAAISEAESRLAKYNEAVKASHEKAEAEKKIIQQEKATKQAVYDAKKQKIDAARAKLKGLIKSFRGVYLITLALAILFAVMQNEDVSRVFSAITILTFVATAWLRVIEYYIEPIFNYIEKKRRK